MLYHKTLPIVQNQALQGKYHVLQVDDAELAALCAPGMFFELKADSDGQKDRLYKPISIYDVKEGRLSFLIKNIGPGTEAICRLAKDAPLRLLGPLGNSFPLLENSSLLLVSGGVGYPPIAWLKKVLSPSNRVLHLHGGACGTDVFPCDIVCTDDGSLGRKGFVTAAVAEILAEGQFDAVYSCGPSPLLKALAGLVEPLKHYVSLEAYMACGVGVCHGCAVPVGEGWQRVCKEGPVFAAADVRWEEL